MINPITGGIGTEIQRTWPEKTPPETSKGGTWSPSHLTPGCWQLSSRGKGAHGQTHDLLGTSSSNLDAKGQKQDIRGSSRESLRPPGITNQVLCAQNTENASGKSPPDCSNMTEYLEKVVVYCLENDTFGRRGGTQKSWMALPGKRGHSRLMSSKPCPPLRADSKGFYWFNLKTGELSVRIGVLAFLSLDRAFQSHRRSPLKASGVCGYGILTSSLQGRWLTKVGGRVLGSVSTVKKTQDAIQLKLERNH